MFNSICMLGAREFKAENCTMKMIRQKNGSWLKRSDSQSDFINLL